MGSDRPLGLMGNLRESVRVEPNPKVIVVCDAHYRAGADADEPEGGAIAGLAETGSVGGRPAAASAAWAQEAEGSGAQAVRSLRLLDGVRGGELVPLVWGPLPAVVREVALALRPVAGALARELLRDRPAVATARPWSRPTGTHHAVSGGQPGPHR